MGKGRHNQRTIANEGRDIDPAALPNVPHRLPTLSEIKVKIPGHCFRPTVRQSMTYVAKDVFYVALTIFVMYQLQTNFRYGFLLFPIYWYIQGEETRSDRFRCDRSIV